MYKERLEPQSERLPGKKGYRLTQLDPSYWLDHACSDIYGRYVLNIPYKFWYNILILLCVGIANEIKKCAK